MNIWKRGVCLLLTLVMAAALAGCGTRREPQTLRVCLPELPGTLDPAMVTTDSERIVVSHLYENLMKLSSDGQGGSRVEAGAARKYTCTDNNDGTTTIVFSDVLVNNAVTQTIRCDVGGTNDNPSVLSFGAIN